MISITYSNRVHGKVFFNSVSYTALAAIQVRLILSNSKQSIDINPLLQFSSNRTRTCFYTYSFCIYADFMNNTWQSISETLWKFLALLHDLFLYIAILKLGVKG